jgi:two-component system chemotaxis response regulator CheB
LFQSVAHIRHKQVIGAILTGMGHDGAAGLLKIREAGFPTLGQSEASCTVYGMPKAAKAHGSVEKEVALGDMAKEILKLCNG